MNSSKEFGEYSIVSRINHLELLLNSNLPTTLWISDLHGEGERFKSVLKRRFGILFQTCAEALPKNFTPEKIAYIAGVIRKDAPTDQKSMGMDWQDVILCLCDVLRYKLLNSSRHYRDVIPPLFRQIIYKLINHDEVPDIYFENRIVSELLIKDLCITIKRSILDHLIVLGDIFDRGAEPDKIIRILKSPGYSKNITLIFGNHDILWMGACAGNQSLIAEALRITYRYEHTPLLKRLEIDTSKLEAFAEKYYPVNQIGGKFKAKSDCAKSVEKALAMIQFKLEEQCILKNPEFEMEPRLQLENLAKILRDGDQSKLNDTHFPTLDLENPQKLTEEEKEIMQDLSEQFRTNRKLMNLMKLFFRQGKMYHVYNSMLNIHALLPSNAEGNFDSFAGFAGKSMMDFFQNLIEKIGERYLNSHKQDEKDLAKMFYLWCGPKSPLFGKDAMKTFERYFFSDKATHKETLLYWEKNLETRQFKSLLKKEFGIERVIFGHTPVNYAKGQKVADKEGFAINVDGGFAQAYFNRGHALVQTPYQLYEIILPTPDELTTAKLEKKMAPIQVQLIKNFNKPVKIKNTVMGKKLFEEKQKLLARLNEETPKN